MNTSMWIRVMHRVHRGLGSVLAVLLAVWFASGAVMTFARYPTYSEHERLAQAPLLRSSSEIRVPAVLRAWLQTGGLRHGSRARLAMTDGRPTWLWRDERGRRRALAADGFKQVKPFDQSQARRIVAERFAEDVSSVELLEDFDQWTVGSHYRPWFPLLRLQLADQAHTQIYLSTQTGEVVQQSTRSERVLAWLGPIPHWIYPAALRHHADVWHYGVLTLSTLALCLSLSGVITGLHVHRVSRRNQRRRGTRDSLLRDPYLRWHQRLGLVFGVFVSSWLFSGALSLSPFEWSRGPWPSDAELQRLHTTPVTTDDPLPVAAALAACLGQLEVRELELVGFAERVFAVCADANGKTRLVDLYNSTLRPVPILAAAQLGEMTQRLAHAGDRLTVDLTHQADNYHYPTHQDQTFVSPYARLTLPDSERTTYYLDPARLRLLARHTHATRLTRWIYHGLHSLDLPGLYARRTLWRSVVMSAMAVGLTLSLLGLGMSVRRFRRSLRARQTRALALHTRPQEGP